MTFQPGHTLSPGRRLGSRNKLGREFDAAFEEAKARGYTHPFLRMMEIANDPNEPTERRDTMLLAAASYACPKAGTIQHQFVAEAPHITTVEQAENFLATLAIEFAPELNPVELSSLIRAWIASKREGQELDLKVNPPETKPQIIKIVGGLDRLPGTAVVMPGDEEQKTNGHALEPPKEFPTPGEAKAQGPHPLQKHHFAPALGSSCEPATGTNSTTGQGPDGRLAATEERRDSVPETSAQEPLT